MAEQQAHHHHHNHSHKKEGASRFKQKSLAALHRRKLIEKILWYILVALAVIMAFAAVVVFFLD